MKNVYLLAGKTLKLFQKIEQLFDLSLYQNIRSLNDEKKLFEWAGKHLSLGGIIGRIRKLNIFNEESCDIFQYIKNRRNEFVHCFFLREKNKNVLEREIAEFYHEAKSIEKLLRKIVIVTEQEAERKK